MTHPAGHRPALDGLRAVAVVLVILFHSGIGSFAHGYVGVDVFFVLSGYLVTSVVLTELEGSGRLSLRRFYARRMRRLLPASLLMVTVVAVAAPLLVPQLQRRGFGADVRSALLYVANWHFADSATDYFADDIARSPFLHFWSLAIEEQFYVVLPVLVVGLAWVAVRRGWASGVRPALTVVAVVLAVASVVRQITLAGRDPLTAYYATDARLYQLLVGVALATTVPHWSRAMVGQKRLASVAGVVVGALLCLLATPVVDLGTSSRGLLAAGLSAVLLVGLDGAPASAAARVLSARPAVSVGSVSYAMYLWHWPIVVIAPPVLRTGPVATCGVALLGSYGLALASGRLLERPVRRAGFLDPVPRVVVAGGLALGVVGAVVLPSTVTREARPASWARTSTYVDVVSLSDEVDLRRVRDVLAEPVPSQRLVAAAAETRPAYDEFSCDPTVPESCRVFGTEESVSGPSVLLMGDSNAAMWVPAVASLAERFGFDLWAMSRPGCPWQDGLTWQTDNEALVAQCVSARDAAYRDLIPALAPDVVIVTGVPRDPGSRVDNFWAQDLDEVAEATARSIEELTAEGARLVVLEPLPYSTEEPTVCLSAADSVSECAFETVLDPYPTEIVYRSLADQRDDVWSVDLDLIGCPLRPVCAAVVDGDIVFRDRYHLAVGWIADHTDSLWSAIVTSGALSGWFDPAG